MSKEKRLVVRFRFPAPSDGRLNRFERLTEDGMVEVEEPAEKVQGTVLQQLAADAKTSGDRSLYEAELRRIVDNSFAVERDHAVRAHVDDLLRERAAVRLPWRDELFAEIYTTAATETRKRGIGWRRLLTKARQKLPIGDARRADLTEHFAREWLETQHKP